MNGWFKHEWPAQMVQAIEVRWEEGLHSKVVRAGASAAICGGGPDSGSLDEADSRGQQHFQFLALPA